MSTAGLKTLLGSEKQHRELQLAPVLRAEVPDARLEKRRISLDIVNPRRGVALLPVPGGR